MNNLFLYYLYLSNHDFFYDYFDIYRNLCLFYMLLVLFIVFFLFLPKVL